MSRYIYDRLQWALRFAAGKISGTDYKIRIVYYSWARGEYVTLVRPTNDYRRILRALNPEMLVLGYGWADDFYVVEVAM